MNLKTAPKAKVVYVGTSDDNLIKDMKKYRKFRENLR